MKVSVRDFKARLSKYLRHARAGGDVVVTSRGRAIARILPISEEAAEAPSSEELLRRLKLWPGVRMGTGGKPLGAKKPIRIPPGEKTLSQIVIEDRG